VSPEARPDIAFGGMPMRKISVAAVLLFVLVSCAHAEDLSTTETKPVQLALFNPAQIFNESIGIKGVRLNLLYGRNVFVRGLDVGLVNTCGGGESVGLQWGLLGYNEGSFLGIQWNMFNLTEGDFSGLQWGIYNDAGDGEGLQFGLVNTSTNMRGLQIALVNYTQTMHGLQVGLVNIIRKKETLPVMVLVNWSF
jgi:hypothetical protein